MAAVPASADRLDHARLAVADLSLSIIRQRRERGHIDIPHPHRGRKYQDASIRFAYKSNRLESDFTDQVKAAAAEVTAICSKNWHTDAEILGLWHQLALAVTEFSEHPSKKIAALIISEKGELQAFAANRVPDDVPKRGKHYLEGVRKDFIVCSERIALARLLGVKVKLPPTNGIGKMDRHHNIMNAISAMTDTIAAVGQNSSALKKSFILTTTSPCEICAHTIAPFAPKAVIAGQGGHEHFRETRKLSIIGAQEFLKAHKIPVIKLPAPTFV